MEQTAVEWMAAHVNHVIDLHNKKLISEEEFRSLLIEYREQSKAMEKEQIIDAYDAGLYDTTFCEKVHAEQYYNETFKSVKHNTDIRSMDKLIESNKKFDENNLKGFKYDPNDRSEDTPDITNFFY